MNLPRFPERAGDVGLLLLRLVAGLSLAFAHGIRKMPPSERFLATVTEMGFPFPVLFAWAAGMSEFVGGILLAIGLLTRPSALFIAFTMCVAAFIRHAPDPYAEKELPLVLAAVALMFVLNGAGRYSLDAILFRKWGNEP